MRTFAIRHYGKRSPLEMIDLPKPYPGPHDVLIQVKAASINPVDFKIRNGELKVLLKFKFPLILGNDCSGIVAEVGREVKNFKVGDEVYCRTDKEHIGTFAEFVVSPQETMALKPKGITFEEAASLPLVALTSMQAFQNAGLKKNDKVLIQAGSGGVGTIAIQIAKHQGAYVATTTSTTNVSFVKNLGADEVIDYKKEDFCRLLKNFDLVFDTLGGKDQRKGFTILKPGGHLISVVGPPTRSFAKAYGLGLPLQLAMAALSFSANRNAKKQGAHYQFLFMHPSGEELKQLASDVESKKIKPVIDRVFPFTETPEAMAYVETGRARGKVVISIS